MEPYTNIGDVFKGLMRDFKFDEKYWKYFGLFECVEKGKSVNLRYLDDNILIGDVLSCWEILKKVNQDQINFSRIFLGFKYYPI